MSQAEKPWFETAFESGYLDVYPHRDLDAARVEVAWLMKQGVGGRTLDLCCGFGRHSLALLENGVDVIGLDLSADLLSQAKNLEGGEALAGRLLRGDVRYLPFASGSVDSLVNLFSSFGYFGEAGDQGVLDEITRVLRPGSRLVMDLMNPDRIRAGLVPESRTERDGFVLLESRRLEDSGQRVTKQVRIVNVDGRERSWKEDVRLYSPDRMGKLLQERGIEVDRVAGSFAGEPFSVDSTRQLLIARKV
ncbi:MAG: class I SAM-dependent methyltransferase [Planctomycetota bacterium]|nr:class I SAM-dependent methyltransferase [Planctomycetota bacterium]